MGKLKYVKIKDIRDKSKEISKKQNISSFKIALDIIKCAFKYGSSVLNYDTFEFYSLTDEERSTYLTDWYYDKILDKYKSSDFDDILEYYNMFKEYLYRDFIDLRVVSFKEFKEFISDKEKIIVRCVNGRNTEVILTPKSRLKNGYNVLKIYNGIMKSEQFIVEDFITIDKDKTIYSDNFRVTCFISEDNKFNVLEVILKSGDKYARLNNDGEIVTPFIDSDGNVSHSDIVGFKFPNYDKIVSFVRELSSKVINSGYMSFDVAYLDGRLVFVNISVSAKSFQPKPSVSGIRNGNLPIYRKFMDL